MPTYDDLVQLYQSGQITTVDFITQQSEETQADYKKFCKENGLPEDSEDSALSFIDNISDLIETSTEF